MPKIGILGAKGRMGRAIALAADERGASLSGGIDQKGVKHKRAKSPERTRQFAT